MQFAGRKSRARICAALCISGCISGFASMAMADAASAVSANVSAVSMAGAFPPNQPVSSQLLSRGWQPPVAFAGEGNERRAVNALREISALQHVMLSNTRFDTQTEQFVDGLWASFELFDLRKFYELLPEKQDDWHFLQVYGVVEDGRYNVGPKAAVLNKKAGFPDDFGEVAVRVKAREIKRERDTYLIDAQVGLGMGTVGWPAISKAVEQTLRVVVKGDDAFARATDQPVLARYRERVLAMNDKLGKEDIEVIAPLWAAFPAQWDLLAALGHFDDVVVEDVAGAEYKKLNATFLIDLDRMKTRYPALADHLSGMGSLNKTDVRAVGPQGDVFHVSLDSEKLMGRFEAYVKDGYLVPVKDGQVAAQPLTGMFNQPWHLDLVGDSRMKILGVVTEMHNLRMSLDFTPEPGGAKTVASLTKVPDISVSGKALGIMPTAVIDAFMPSDIESLMRDFLQVMCEGNDGHGMVASMEYRQAEGSALATLDTHTTFEGLNNFFVQFGMGIVNRRVIPDANVSNDVRRLMFDTQQAFSQDLEAYSQLALNRVDITPTL